MDKRRPYLATVANIIYPGLILLSSITTQFGKNEAGSDGYTLDTNPALQTGFDVMAIVYTTPIVIFAIMGLFKLGAAKSASYLAIPLYFILFIVSTSAGLADGGSKLDNLPTIFRILFVGFGILAILLIWACIRTIRFNPATEAPPAQKGKISGNDYWKSPR